MGATQGCDASILLVAAGGAMSEQTSQRSFGMRNFKYVATIKDALERECPKTVSCADIVALSARDGVALVSHRRSLWRASARLPTYVCSTHARSWEGRTSP